jgi:long-chain fatty acid transport protein
MKFTLPMAYRPMENLSLGFAPVIQYGSLGMSYNAGAVMMGVDRDATGAPTGNTTYSNVRTGAGVSDDLGFGFQLGLGYEIAGVSIGAVYKSAISMTYSNQISEATTNFGLSGYGDDLEQPAEIGLGVSYTMGESTIALDYKQIGWSSAAGYEDFRWEDQNVIALGYEYKAKTWALRVGYNHANNPIKEQAGASGFNAQEKIGNYEGAVLNYFNLAGFPAIIEDHYTIGGSVNVGEAASIDLAYVYSPEVSASFDTSAMSQGQYFNSDNTATTTTPFSTSANVKHSQSALTIAANIAF